MPLPIMTSPPFIPGLHGPIHVIVMFTSGALWPSVRNTMVILELKSPVIWPRVVRAAPGPNLQVETVDQEPSILWVIELDEQFFWRTCELKTDIFACDSSLTQDCVVKGLPAIIMELSQRPIFWCGTAVSAEAIPAAASAASAMANEYFIENPLIESARAYRV